MIHLWEPDHAYVCADNYFNRNMPTHYDSWTEFVEDEGDNDKNLNLLFRWDWVSEDGVDILHLYLMGQRHGIYRSVVIHLCRDDEPAVLAYLRPRWAHMRALWAPLSEEDART